jgi:hypothetical protein
MEFPSQRLAHLEDGLKEDGLGAVRLEDGLTELRSVIDVIEALVGERALRSGHDSCCHEDVGKSKQVTLQGLCPNPRGQAVTPEA